LIDLAQGEVDDIPTPEHVKEAARRALHDNRTKYTPTAGVRELRQALAKHFSRDMSLRLEPPDVMASTGAKQCAFNFLMAVLDPGDEVLLPAPYWGSYLRQVEMAGGRPRVLRGATAPDFKVTGAAVRNALSPRTRVLILNNPNNPSGAVYSRRELEDILDAALSARLLVMADEVYHRLTYDGNRHTCFASLSPEAAALTVTVDAVSKSYCMTGWRLGFAAGPRDLIAAMERVQSYSTSCPNVIAQWATIAALEGDQSCVDLLRDELDGRRRLAVSLVRGIAGVDVAAPSGGLYVFPSVPGAPDDDFASRLAAATGVLVGPGAAFGVPDHIRICFGASRRALEEGLGRLSSWTRQTLVGVQKKRN
jgi:aspartate aminotransferase